MSTRKRFSQSALLVILGLGLIAVGVWIIWFAGLESTDLRSRLARRFLIGLGLALVIVVPIETVRRFINLRRRDRLVADGVRLAGKVVALSARLSNDPEFSARPLRRKTCRMVYEFTPPQATAPKRARVRFPVSASRSWKVGDPILILCDPKDPRRHLPDVKREHVEALRALIGKVADGDDRPHGRRAP